MGLLYVLPCSEKEQDHVKLEHNQITLKSYGLPQIWWFYLIAVLMVVSVMGVAVYAPIIKLLNSEDILNVALALLVSTTLVLTPLALIIFYFYGREITKKGHSLKVQHFIFGLRVKTNTYSLKGRDSFKICHFLSSPNLARIRKETSMRAFENQGYWELHAELEDGGEVLLDRNNRKADLVKIAKLLSR
jgi:hypothetical protein